MVAPASLIPFAGVALIWLIYLLKKKQPLPGEIVPFLLFISAAFVSSAGAFFLSPPPFKGTKILAEIASALVTLLIGAAFYIVTSGWLSRQTRRMRLTLRMIDISGAVMLAWAVVQGVFIFFFNSRYPEILQSFQSLVSTRSLFFGRITSFAFEPSWLAQQVNLLFLPYWLAATVTGWSAFRFRLGRLSLETLLLAAGVVILFVSSRVGTLSLLLVLAFLGVHFNVQMARRLQNWTLQRLNPHSSSKRKIFRLLLPVAMMILFLGAYILIALALVYILSHVDWRLARFFQVTSLAKLKTVTGSIYQLFNYLAFAERYVYWEAGWNVFNHFPILGAGLGNAGFYFQDALLAYSWNLPEVMDTYFRFDTVPNIKSLWLRLLAETGIVGFSAFLAWLAVVFKSAWNLRLKTSRPVKPWAGSVFLCWWLSSLRVSARIPLPCLTYGFPWGWRVPWQPPAAEKGLLQELTGACPEPKILPLQSGIDCGRWWG